MLRTILAVIAGLIVGGIVNMAIIMVGPMIIPPPAGADMTTAEGLKAAMPMLEARHFIAPFLAHALNALVGAFVAALISVSHKFTAAMIIGVLTLAGGIVAATMIPAPMWFIALDLIVAYIPMAWLGWKLAAASRS